MTHALRHGRTASDPSQSDRYVQETCSQLLKTHARSFRWASVFLPRFERSDAAVVYALCRTVDDAVDEAADEAQARARLAELQEDVHRERPRIPVVAAFVRVATRRGISLEWTDHLISGVRSDIGAVRFADDAQLIRYCYEVAGTVGLMMCALMGVRDPKALAHAIDLGVAMQLTNICRDVLEDAQRDRVYLPASRLREVGLEQQHVIEGSADVGALSRVVSDVLSLAESYYQSGQAGMRYIPPRARLAILVASRLYRAIGRRLLSRYGGNPLNGRAVVSWVEKALWVAWAPTLWLLSFFAGIPRTGHRAELHTHLNGLPGVATRAALPAEQSAP